MKTGWKLLVFFAFWGFHAPNAAGETPLLIWSHWKEEPVKIRFMQATAQGFERRTGIPVELVFLPRAELIEKLVFALDSSGPDLTYMDAGPGFAHPRITRSLADLRDLTISGELVAPDWSLGRAGERPNTFLPIEGISNAIYYNKDLFEDAGIALPADRPATDAEFLEIIRSLRRAGITPIGEGASDCEGKIPIPVINTIFRYAGPEKVEQLFAGNLSFSDPDVVNALTFWKQVVDARGYNPDNALDLTLLEGIFEVTDGRAAISFCGTYIYSKYGTTERDRGQIGVMDWFTIGAGKGNGLYELFWAAGFAVNANSPRVEEGKRFLEYLMTAEAASLWIRYVQAPYPVMADDIPDDSLYGTLMRLRAGQQPAPGTFTHAVFHSKALQTLWEQEIRRFIIGERTVEQFVERMNSRRQ